MYGIMRIVLSMLHVTLPYLSVTLSIFVCCSIHLCLLLYPSLLLYTSVCCSTHLCILFYPSLFLCPSLPVAYPICLLLYPSLPIAYPISVCSPHSQDTSSHSKVFWNGLGVRAVIKHGNTRISSHVDSGIYLSYSSRNSVVFCLNL